MLQLAMKRLLSSGQVTEWNRLVSESKIPMEVWQEGNCREPRISGVNLCGRPLNRFDLPGIELGSALLNGASLNNANLKGCNLRGAQLIEAELIECDLSGAYLCGANLKGANLSGANLTGADLRNAKLHQAEVIDSNLSDANLQKTYLQGTVFDETNLAGADLSNSDARYTSFYEADLRNAVLTHALMNHSDFTSANLSNAILDGTSLEYAILSDAYLTGAQLTKAQLSYCTMVRTHCDGANFNGCSIYGISAWDLNSEKVAEQSDLIVTPDNQSIVTVDNIEIAQFVYLLLNNAKIRDVIETIGKKGVLILGRFRKERKDILNAIKNKLREIGYVPMMFDFEKPTQRDFTETIKTLAGLSRFIIADITNPSSSPLELQATMPEYMIPFVPIIQEHEEPFSMFRDLKQKYGEWVLDVLRYDTEDNLIDVLEDAVVAPALEVESKLHKKKIEPLFFRHVKQFSKK